MRRRKLCILFTVTVSSCFAGVLVSNLLIRGKRQEIRIVKIQKEKVVDTKRVLTCHSLVSVA